MFAKADVILPNYTVINQNYVAFFFVFLPILTKSPYAPKTSVPEVSGSNPAFLTMIR